MAHEDAHPLGNRSQIHPHACSSGRESAPIFTGPGLSRLTSAATDSQGFRPPKAPEAWRTPRRFAPSGHGRKRASVLDCGGKRSATPLSHARDGLTFDHHRSPEGAVAAPALPAHSGTRPLASSRALITSSPSFRALPSRDSRKPTSGVLKSPAQLEISKRKNFWGALPIRKLVMVNCPEPGMAALSSCQSRNARFVEDCSR